MISFSSPPGWWTTYEVLDSQAQPDDYAVVNQGQAKHLASKTRDYFNDILPGGAGNIINAMVNSWSVANLESDDYTALNIGQVKNLAKPFYDKLIEMHYATGYPWTSTLEDDEDYALVNIGQLKHLFSFDLSLAANDSDSDGLPDWWETYYFGDLSHASGGDADGDGLTNLEEWQRGTNPFSTDSDGDGVSDGWEVQYLFNPLDPDDSALDADGDGWTNLEEYLAGTDPHTLNTSLPAMVAEIFTYDQADRLQGIAAPASATLDLDDENNILSSQ